MQLQCRFSMVCGVQRGCWRGEAQSGNMVAPEVESPGRIVGVYIQGFEGDFDLNNPAVIHNSAGRVPDAIPVQIFLAWADKKPIGTNTIHVRCK